MRKHFPGGHYTDVTYGNGGPSRHQCDGCGSPLVSRLEAWVHALTGSAACPGSTVGAVAAFLAAAGFAEYHDGQPGFTVTPAAFGSEIIVDLRGADLLPFNPGEGPRALLDDYRAALAAAGYHARSTGAMVIVSSEADPVDGEGSDVD
jgi:hypothetical protein